MTDNDANNGARRRRRARYYCLDGNDRTEEENHG